MDGSDGDHSTALMQFTRRKEEELVTMKWQ